MLIYIRFILSLPNSNFKSPKFLSSLSLLPSTFNFCISFTKYKVSCPILVFIWSYSSKVNFSIFCKLSLLASVKLKYLHTFCSTLVKSILFSLTYSLTFSITNNFKLLTLQLSSQYPMFPLSPPFPRMPLNPFCPFFFTVLKGNWLRGVNPLRSSSSGRFCFDPR